MAKEFKIGELFALRDEAAAILSLEISVLTRYKLLDVKKVCEEKIKPVLEVRDELIKKYGTLNESGQSELKNKTEDGKINEQFIKYTEEIEPLLEQEEPVEFKTFTMSEFEKLSTSFPLEIIFKLIN